MNNCKESLMSFFQKSKEEKLHNEIYWVHVIGDDRKLILATGSTAYEAWLNAYTKVYLIWSALLTPKAAATLSYHMPQSQITSE